MNFGIWTLLPAILVIVTAIISKRTTESLLLGATISYVIISISTGQNLADLMVRSFFEVLTDYDTIWLIVVCGLFGSLIALISDAKGTHAIARFLGKICKGQKSTLLVSWILGIIIFIDDYMNILTISACTKKLSDQRKIPRESLAYVIDSTGAPVCVLVPFSTWAIFFAGVFYELECVQLLGYQSAMETYIHAIPFMFYAIAAVVMVPFFALNVIPKIGPMKQAYKRVEYTGRVYSERSDKYNKAIESNESSSASILDFIIPISVMIITQLLTDDMFIAVIISIIVCAILFVPRKKIRANRFCDLWIQGFSESVPALAIIVAALYMRQASSDLNLPTYVINMVEPFVSKNMYPMMAFLIVSLLGFITGSNWGIPAVCAPIIIPLGAAVNANILLVIAAIVCGGTFCSHACFYSDATVITSNACGIDNMEHVYTQLPYALIALIIASVSFLIAGFVF